MERDTANRRLWEISIRASILVELNWFHEIVFSWPENSGHSTLCAIAAVIEVVRLLLRAPSHWMKSTKKNDFSWNADDLSRSHFECKSISLNESTCDFQNSWEITFRSTLASEKEKIINDKRQCGKMAHNLIILKENHLVFSRNEE